MWFNEYELSNLLGMHRKGEGLGVIIRIFDWELACLH